MLFIHLNVSNATFAFPIQAVLKISLRSKWPVAKLLIESFERNKLRKIWEL